MCHRKKETHPAVEWLLSTSIDYVFLEMSRHNIWSILSPRNHSGSNTLKSIRFRSHNERHIPNTETMANRVQRLMLQWKTRAVGNRNGITCRTCKQCAILSKRKHCTLDHCSVVQQNLISTENASAGSCKWILWVVFFLLLFIFATDYGYNSKSWIIT